ncbi:MAG TPA: biopolymer transporter ExbD [bacterium]|nr:biopolymer transporter ExbD [bacterium]
MRSRLRGSPKLVAEINMVPFTDVVLVLLVIFMVTTPFLFQGTFQVKLPKVAAPSPNLPETITVMVAQGDRIFLNDQETPLDELAAKLASLLKERPNAVFLLSADKNVSHGTVTEVLSKAYQAGVVKMGISVELPNDGQGGKP